MVKIISIQRMGACGVVQFVAAGKAGALEFPAKLTDAEVRKLVDGRKGKANARNKKS